MLLTISSVHGSPGATSWALLLAAAWPVATHPDRIAVEADCSGGVLGARYGFGVEPGAVSLASDCRRSSAEVDPNDHGRRLAEGLWVVPGPEVAEQAVPVWRSGAADVAEVLARDRRLWVADLGRCGPDSPVRPLAAAAALNVVIGGAAVENIVQMPSRIDALSEAAPTAVVIAGRSGFAEDELQTFLGGRALWIVPAPDELPRLVMRTIQGGRARRSPLWRVAVEVAADLAALVRHPRHRQPASKQPATKLPAPEQPVGEKPAPPFPPPARRLEPLPPKRPSANPPTEGNGDRVVSAAVQAALANSHLVGEGSDD